jgi:hypothetical protein
MSGRGRRAALGLLAIAISITGVQGQWEVPEQLYLVADNNSTQYNSRFRCPQNVVAQHW